MIPVNPCAAADPPRRNRPELATWSAVEARRFLDGTAEHPLAALYALLLGTGLRRGEALALRWDDVDLKKGAVSIRRSLTRDERDHWLIGEVKTPAARRSIRLPASVAAGLERHRRRQLDQKMRHRDLWREQNLVFPRPDGELLHLTNWVSCCRSRKSPSSPVEGGVSSAAAAHLANKALREGGSAEWKE